MARALTVERFDWAGQGPAIDLADTVVIVREGEVVDHLSSAEQLARWLELERQCLGPVDAEDAPALARVVELRSAIRALLAAAAVKSALPRTAVSVVNRYSAKGSWSRQIDLSDPLAPRLAYGSTRGSRADQVLATIAESAIDLLVGPVRARIKVCLAPSCGMFFVETRTGQQWCSVPCGNRARVARHYKRSRSN